MHNIIEKELQQYLGVDNVIHTCFPWESIAICGMKIKTKNSDMIDYTKHHHCDGDCMHYTY